MNATSLDELRAAVSSREAGDEKMEQVRELLIGDDLRRGETRIAALEARVHELENDVAGRLDQLYERIEAIAAEGDAQRRQAFMELAKSVLDLGDQVRGISKA